MISHTSSQKTINSTIQYHQRQHYHQHLYRWEMSESICKAPFKTNVLKGASDEQASINKKRPKFLNKLLTANVISMQVFQQFVPAAGCPPLQ